MSPFVRILQALALLLLIEASALPAFVMLAIALLLHARSKALVLLPLVPSLALGWAEL